MPFNCISTESLTNGELITLGAIEIRLIPHISIIDNRQNAITKIVKKYKNELGSMLTEIYQVYKSMIYVSIESLWATQSVTNQPFNTKRKMEVSDYGTF